MRHSHLKSFQDAPNWTDESHTNAASQEQIISQATKTNQAALDALLLEEEAVECTKQRN